MMGSTKGRSNHWWGTGREPGCVHCGLVERTEWHLDVDGRPAMGLVWVRPDGSAVAKKPFKFSKNRRPETRPASFWAHAHPGVPVAGTPNCPKTHDAWLEAL